MPKKVSKQIRYYDSYISRVLFHVSPYNGITINAREQLNNVLIILSDIIAKLSIELTKIGNRKTISDKEIERAIKLIFKGELQKESIEEGKLAVQNLKEIDVKGKRRQVKAKIIFPPSITEKFLRQFNNSNFMVTATSPVFLAAVIEYFASQILEPASHIATRGKHTRITTRDLNQALVRDEELRAVFDNNNIEFLGAGVIEFIHPSLITRKGQKSKNNKKNSIPGTVAVKEIRKYQRYGNCLIFPKYPFERFTRSIIEDHKKNIKISKNVFIVLQYYIEQFLINLLTHANLLAIHSGHIKLLPTDIDLVRTIKECQAATQVARLEMSLSLEEKEKKVTENLIIQN
jgi:histone H3/H4